MAAEQFCDIYVIDFKGDARTSGEIRRREGDNIFENAIKVGIAISFMVRKASSREPSKIHYVAVPDYAKLEEKQAFIAGKRLRDMPFDLVKPDAKHNWVGLSENNWDAFPPIASKATKAARTSGQMRAIFHTYTLGMNTARDEWAYSMDKADLITKAKALVAAYEAVRPDTTVYPDTLKWSRNLKRRLSQGRREKFNAELIRRTNYRPFVPRWLYQSSLFIDEAGGLDGVFPVGRANQAICFSDIGSRTDVCIVAIDGPADLHFGAAINIYQQAPRFWFSEDGEQQENITDWALRLFEKTYGKFGSRDPNRTAFNESKADVDAPSSKAAGRKAEQRTLTKEGIFHYVYGVLYDPIYREKYAANLKREFPRIPFYAGFWQWSDWGKALIRLHVGFHDVEPWPLNRVETPLKGATPLSTPKVLLKADKEKGIVYVDSDTSLLGVPKEVWAYKLGNRSAMEWVLDQHKERKPRDPVIAASFNTYRLSAFKEQVVDLLARVARVSVETVRITEEMKAAKR